MNPSLAERLKVATRTLHVSAERSRFMHALLRGQVERPAYCALLRSLHTIYAALEPALERHATHPGLAPLVLPAFWRTRALEHDLLALQGPAWADDLAVQPTARIYADHLNQLDREHPHRLVAHVYVRYLGDLSGGQMLHAVVAGSPTLGGAGAVAFYEFGDAATVQALKQTLRSGLATLALDDAAQDDVVAEAEHAFRLHLQLFDELPMGSGLKY